MADFNTFVQTELPLRPVALDDGLPGQLLFRRGPGPRQVGWTWVDHLAESATYHYDSQGNVDLITESVQGSTRETTLTYDAQGNVGIVCITYAGYSRTETYSYDSQGNVTQMLAVTVAI